MLSNGCTREPIVPDDLNPPAIETVDMPDYRELVERYNENVRMIPRLWVRTRVEMRWRDEKNRQRREVGDGRLIFDRPLNTAMTVEVLGDTKLWAGSDENGFWVFDLLNDKTAYYGSYSKPLAQPLPLPVQPEAVPYLLGLIEIDPRRLPIGDPVKNVDGYALIQPPDLKMTFLLHPETGLPARIDLIDAQGESVLVSRLTGEIEVAVAEGESPILPAKAELFPIGEESRMTLDLTRATTRPDKVKSKWFRFDTLRAALKPSRIIDLNQ